MNHYLKYHYYTKDGTVITRIKQISSREIAEQVFPSRNIFGIEIFDSENLPQEFSNYQGRDFLNKNFYEMVSNVQKFMVGQYLPFEDCKLGHCLTRHDIASGRRWGLTGFCVTDGHATMVGPDTIILSPKQVRFATDAEQA